MCYNVSQRRHNLDNQRKEYDYTQAPLWCLHNLCSVYCSESSFVLSFVYYHTLRHFSSPFTGYHFHKTISLSVVC